MENKNKGAINELVKSTLVEEFICRNVQSFINYYKIVDVDLTDANTINYKLLFFEQVRINIMEFEEN